MIPTFRVFIDFDGTLVEPNVAILLVERFCEDGTAVAHEVDEQLHSGRITLRQAWERQAALLPAGRIGEMTQWAVETVPLRKGAMEFLRTLSDRRVPVAIVSGGLDFYIKAVLQREGLDLPFVSDRLRVDSGGKVEVLHPFGHATCHLCGICKAQVVRSSRPVDELTVFIGDGSTDRYAAEVADIVFARHRLKSYCERANIPFVPFDDFHEVERHLSAWLDGRSPVPLRPTLGRSDSPCPISQSLAMNTFRSSSGPALPPGGASRRLGTEHVAAQDVVS